MMLSRWLAARRGVVAAAATVVIAGVGGEHAHAQGKLEARYVASVAGIPIGKGIWVVDIAEDHYAAAASGGVTGVLSAVTSGEGSAASRGGVHGGRLSPTTFATRVTADGKVDEVRMALQGGTVKDLTAEPPLPPSPDRVALTDNHRRGVIDPMTAGLMPVAGAGDVLTAEACQRTLSIFDGRQRFDLALSFKRMDKVKADKGYQGPAVVCTVLYQPVAGHRPSRSAIKYLMETRDMEIALVPIAGTRVLVPFRIAIPTAIGPAVLQATQFVTTSQSARPAPVTNAKTQ